MDARVKKSRKKSEYKYSILMLTRRRVFHEGCSTNSRRVFREGCSTRRVFHAPSWHLCNYFLSGRFARFPE